MAKAVSNRDVCYITAVYYDKNTGTYHNYGVTLLNLPTPPPKKIKILVLRLISNAIELK